MRSLSRRLQTMSPSTLPAGRCKESALSSGAPSSQIECTSISTGHTELDVHEVGGADGGNYDLLRESTTEDRRTTSLPDSKNVWSGSLFSWPKRSSCARTLGDRAKADFSTENGGGLLVDTEVDDLEMTTGRADADDDMTELKTGILSIEAAGEANTRTGTCSNYGLKGGKESERQVQNVDRSGMNGGKHGMCGDRGSTKTSCVSCRNAFDRHSEDSTNEHESGTPSNGLSPRRLETKKSGLSWTAAIILKSFIGGGFLFLPHVFMRGGLILSFLIFSLVFAAALYCMILLVRCCRPGVTNTYEELAEQTYGKRARRMVEFCVVISQLAFSTVNIVLAAGNIRDVIWTASGCDPKFEIPTRVLLWVGAVAYVPLCLIRQMKHLAPIAFIANVGTGVGIIMLLAALGFELAARKEPVEITLFDCRNFPLVLGTVIYMWEGTGLVLPIRDNATKKVQESFPRVLSLCLGALFLTYTGFVIYANFTFGVRLESVVLFNLPANILGVSVQAVVAFAISSSVPLMMFPASAIVEHRLLSRFKFSSWTYKIAVCSTLRILLVVLILAAATVGLQQIDNFVALIGGACGAPLTFVFPTLLHMKLHPDEPKLRRFFHSLIVVGGLGVQIFSIYWTVTSWRGITEFPARCSA
uniref:Putative amino acid transporter n=1 Tax=Neospora caninum (strain Liverpool) TaxID=572307 RepID=A0A0F7UIH1_NEOCL|nr:TPA: putative amino acid transporter [Neospora caninum Liverpool]